MNRPQRTNRMTEHSGRFRMPARLRGQSRLREQDRRQRGSKRRTGAAMVEFAIIANVLFVIVLTCIEFARMNMVRNLAQDAAYFAARQVIVPGATADEAIEEAENIMNTMLNGGYTVTVNDFDFDSEEISVTITVDFAQVALFTPLFLGDNEIETTAIMRTERYEGFYEQ